MTPTETQKRIAVGRAARPASIRTRAEILAPYLKQLGLGEGSLGGSSELPPTLESGNFILELDDWERIAIKTHPSGTDAKGRPWPGLVMEGLAYQMRCLERVAALDGTSVPPPERQAELIDQLIIDGTIGITLLDDLQWAINRLIREGEVRVAGRLAEFRNAVNQNLALIRTFVGSETFAKSQSAAEKLLDGQFQTLWPEDSTDRDDVRKPRPVGDLHGPRRPKPRPRVTTRVQQVRRVEPSRRSRTRVWLLAVTLVVSLVLWFSVSPRQAESDKSLPSLTAEDFAHIPPVSKADARPPSLYITMNALGWREMNDLERWQVLEQIGTIAGRADFNGVHVRTTDGETVGQWTKLGGSRVLDGARGDS